MKNYKTIKDAVDRIRDIIKEDTVRMWDGGLCFDITMLSPNEWREVDDALDAVERLSDEADETIDELEGKVEVLEGAEASDTDGVEKSP